MSTTIRNKLCGFNNVRMIFTPSISNGCYMIYVYPSFIIYKLYCSSTAGFYWFYFFLILLANFLDHNRVYQTLLKEIISFLLKTFRQIDLQLTNNLIHLHLHQLNMLHILSLICLLLLHLQQLKFFIFYRKFLLSSKI